MSTQRREDGPPSATKTSRWRSRDRWQRQTCTDHANGCGQIWLIFLAWLARAAATVGTAPLQETLGFPAAWTATNSLQSDHSTIKVVCQDVRLTSRSSPPSRAGHGAAPGMSATRRSFPLIPFPAVLVEFHPFLPHDPAGKCRWTERYDGKRDLYFLNAA
jgi:hypothetical protein